MNKILIITKFTSKEMNQAKVAFGSFFLLNLKSSFELHILSNENAENYKEFIRRIKPFCNIEIINDNILGHISKNCKIYKHIILLNQNTLTLQPIEPYFDYFKKFQMVGNLKYQTQFELLEKGFKIPFVEGVFSKGFLMLNNIDFDMNYVEKFIKTFNIKRTYKDFDEIFLSWLCLSKLKTPDISVESTYYHHTKLEGLKLVYFSENPYNAYPWTKTNKLIYIFYYIKEYKKYCEIFKCDFLQEQKIPTLKDFNEDLKKRFTFSSWDKVFIPYSERKIRFSI